MVYNSKHKSKRLSSIDQEGKRRQETKEISKMIWIPRKLVGRTHTLEGRRGNSLVENEHHDLEEENSKATNNVPKGSNK